MASQQEVAQIVAIISAAYPNYSPTEHTVEIYFQSLQDLDFEILKLATMKSINESGRAFAPSVGEIRGTIGEIQRRARGIPSAIDAWDEVCNAPKPYPADYIIYRGGEMVEHPVHRWSHPLVERIAKQFGWPDFPKFEDEGIDRAHFFKQYESAVQNNIAEMMELPQVMKYIEAGNAMKKLADGMKR